MGERVAMLHKQGIAASILDAGKARALHVFSMQVRRVNLHVCVRACVVFVLGGACIYAAQTSTLHKRLPVHTSICTNIYAAQTYMLHIHLCCACNYAAHTSMQCICLFYAYIHAAQTYMLCLTLCYTNIYVVHVSMLCIYLCCTCIYAAQIRHCRLQGTYLQRGICTCKSAHGTWAKAELHVYANPAISCTRATMKGMWMDSCKRDVCQGHVIGFMHKGMRMDYVEVKIVAITGVACLELDTLHLSLIRVRKAAGIVCYFAFKTFVFFSRVLSGAVCMQEPALALPPEGCGLLVPEDMQLVGVQL